LGLAFDPLGVLLVTDSLDRQTRFWGAALGGHLFSDRLGLGCQFRRDGGWLGIRRDGGWLGIRREAGGLDLARVVRSAVFHQLTCPSLKSPDLTGVDLSADGRWLAVGDTTGWVLWDLALAHPVASVPDTHAGRLMFHPDGHSVLALAPDQVSRWPLEVTADSSPVRVGTAKVLVSAPGSSFQGISLSADGAMLAVAGLSHSLLVALHEPARPVRFAPGHVASQVVLDAAQRWVAVAAVNGLGVTVWDVPSGQLRCTLTTNEWGHLALSHDGRTLATATVRECCWWDTATWQVRRRFPLDLHGEVPGCVAFSPDGQLFALTASRQQVVLFDARSGEELARLTAPEAQNMEPLVFSGDGRLLAGGSHTKIIQLWDLGALRRELAALGLDW
jgi:WD40 repeat protein